MNNDRVVSHKFWNDSKVIELDPLNKLLYLYLLTNFKTNLIGCYELPVSLISFDTSIEKDDIASRLKKFEHEHDMIKFNEETSEVLILKWARYHWSDSINDYRTVKKELIGIKSPIFKEYLSDQIKQNYGHFEDSNSTKINDNLSKHIEII